MNNLAIDEAINVPIVAGTMNPITPEDLAVTNATMQKLYETAALAEPLREELKLQGQHLQFARDLLYQIRAALPPDSGKQHFNPVTGLESSLVRLPARVGRLVNAGNDRDHLAGILEKIMQVFDGNPDEGPQDFSELPEWVERIVRENETLARNVPPPPFTPEPPASVSDTPSGAAALMPDQFNASQPTGFSEVIGQAWCRCDRENDAPPDALGLRYCGGWIVLCEVSLNVATGALTYTPLARKDLPDFRG